MDIKTREETLMQKNAILDSPTKGSPEKSDFKSRIPSLERKSRRKREDSTISNISTSSSVSSINSVVAKDEKEKKSLKKVSLAVVKQRRKETGTSELLKTLDEYKRENNRLTDEVKTITREKEQLQSQVAKMTKKEDKIKHELESNNLKLKETENEANLLNAQVERQERELKQRDASSKSDNVRLTRQEEQINKMRMDQHKLHETNSTLREELRSLKDLHQKHATLKDKQIEQLLDGFQKQMQLIDVLRRQKLHLEAAHVLQYTEDEFLQTLDWKPFGHHEGQKTN